MWIRHDWRTAHKEYVCALFKKFVTKDCGNFMKSKWKKQKNKWIVNQAFFLKHVISRKRCHEISVYKLQHSLIRLSLLKKHNRYFCKTHLATLSAAVLSIIFFDAWLCISVLSLPGCLNRNDADAVSFPEWTASNDSLFCYLVLPHTTQPLHMNNFVAGVVLAFPGRCTMSCWMLISRLKLLNCWRD